MLCSNSILSFIKTKCWVFSNFQKINYSRSHDRFLLRDQSEHKLKSIGSNQFSGVLRKMLLVILQQHNYGLFRMNIHIEQRKLPSYQSSMFDRVTGDYVNVCKLYNNSQIIFTTRLQGDCCVMLQSPTLVTKSENCLIEYIVWSCQ